MVLLLFISDPYIDLKKQVDTAFPCSDGAKMREFGANGCIYTGVSINRPKSTVEWSRKSYPHPPSPRNHINPDVADSLNVPDNTPKSAHEGKGGRFCLERVLA